MAQTPEEWLAQSDYDLETAHVMLNAGRNIYAVFMAHLAIEKGLKGIYHKHFNELPPKTHNLIYLLNKNNLTPPGDIGEFIAQLDQTSIATRYPEQLATMQSLYTSGIVKQLLTKTNETILWVKKTF